MSEKLNIYMAYDRHAGPEECATLVFAHTAREAKLVAWKQGILKEICDGDFISAATRRLRDRDHLYAEADVEKLRAGISHEVDNPRSCEECGRWGNPLADDGLCQMCAEERDSDA